MKLVIVLLACSCWATLVHAQSSSGAKALPEGPGLAAQYPGDEGLERDARVLFVEDL